ncbi:MAG: cytochrome ubiquinol oxidase subunit I [Candidatus Magnetoovum sp. WYHC-5]|nr:cytochrome ubiquinol oxidase subunit I [Candidatus Magnetoovum sp. WYHC-5]
MSGWVKKQLILFSCLLVAIIGIIAAFNLKADYYDFPIIEARTVVWILAQTMLLFAAFILAVPVFVLIIEIGGYLTKNERMERLAKDFARLLPISYSITAILGGLFTFASFLLFPKYMKFMAGPFKGTFLLFIILITIESTIVYLYWTTWEKLQGNKKLQHIMLGVALNVVGTLVMMTANIWGSFQLSPAGISPDGVVTSIKSAIFNYTFWPLNIHRFIANISFGGFLCAAYAAYKFLSSKTEEDKAHYDWMGYTGTFVGVATMIFLPFAGYYFGMEIYSYNAQMGITFMGGALSKIWLLQAIVIAVVFIGTCYYLWLGLDRIPGGERYKKYLPYLSWGLVITFAVWATPRAWVASLEDVAGGTHPIFGTVGVMAPKITAVNLAILGVIVTFLINRRAGKYIPQGREMFKYMQYILIGLIIAVNIIVLYMSYHVDSAVRIKMSIYTFLFMAVAIGFIYFFDGLLLKGAQIRGQVQWGKMAQRSQYALIIVAVSNIWAMALLGYGRAAARLNWHVYGVLQDTSKYAGLPSMGRATVIISMITLLFLFLLGVVFKLTATDKKEV